ncbi:DEBR0S1_30526g1_1 [Brettanomyces bruxellensis]|uniref:DEBR0S1_30526g1_1 n=1 Tax=Dekkera bruxellensis TaxID=5007 RepID=A0A7D9GYG9_DEKBR|nr:DEBR0S1_30526g1_1 [Brettanomyces bruxellensis]
MSYGLSHTNRVEYYSSNDEVPVGYVTPSFPSLYLPLGSSKMKYDRSVLYYSSDVWKFFVLWSMIIMAGFYTATAILIIFTHYKRSTYTEYTKNLSWWNGRSNEGALRDQVENLSHGSKRSLASQMIKESSRFLLLIVAVYVFIGVFEGFVSGSLIGILAGAIYNSAQLKMTTWIPFAYSLVVAAFNIVSSYSLTGSLM